MTAIITKQNAKDKAFINGGGGADTGSGEFDTLHVKGDATIDGDILLTSANTQSLTARLLNIDTSISDHETRIQTLEQSGGSFDNNFTFTSGYPEIVIDKAALHETSNDNIHTLTINIDKNTYESYVGAILEFVLPTEFKITDKVIISKQSGWKFTCQVIEYADGNYTLSSLNEQNNPFI